MTTSIHEAAKQHSEQKRGELQSIPIPEFGEGFAIYYYRYLTGAELVELLPFVNWDDPRDTDQRILFEALALAARDESGNRLFNATNKHQIARDWDFLLVERIVLEMGILAQIFEGAATTAKKD